MNHVESIKEYIDICPYSVPVKYREIWPSEGGLWARDALRDYPPNESLLR